MNNKNSIYECLDCGSILKIPKNKLPSNCTCGSKKFSKLAGDFENKEDYDFFQNFQREILQDIITKNEEHATEKICSYIKDKHNIYTTRDDVKSEIWIYNNGVYQPNGESFIKEIVRKFLEHTYTSQRTNKVIAKIEADTMINTDEFFNKSYLNEICVENGILNIETKELLEFTPDKIFFNKLPVEYNPIAECNIIDAFFEDVLKEGDDKNVLYELIGFCLSKNYFLEKAFMFVGDGSNGKSKTLSLIKEFLGIENCCSVRLSQMQDMSSSALCELHNRLINIAGDLDNTALKHTGVFKELSGGDVVQVKRKYLRDLKFTNYAKMVFACNQLPKVYDLSEGFWRRWVLLEFPYKFIPKSEFEKNKNNDKIKLQDPEIIKKLTTKEQMSGLLNQAIKGLIRLKKNKNFSYSNGTSNVKDFWIRKSDSFTAFCLDNLEEDYDGFIIKKKLRNKFLKYCKKYKVKGISDKAMKVVMEDMFGAIESRKMVENGLEYVWEGVKLKENGGNC